MKPVYKIENYVQESGEDAERKLLVLTNIDTNEQIFLADFMIMSPKGPMKINPPIAGATDIKSAFEKYQNVVDEVKAAINKINNQKKIVTANSIPENLPQLKLTQ